MAGATATLVPSISINVTPFSSSGLLHFSANVGFSRQEHRPWLYCNSRLHPRIKSCHGKLNSSSEGDPDEMVESMFDGYDGIEDEIDDDDAESSVDLLIRFFQSLFKKVSKRAKKASRSVLPAVLSPQLVSFAVDGTLLLAFLSIAKALLEVVCNLGGAVFIAILLLRVIWAAVSYFQSSGHSFNQGGSSFGAAA
ncbi:hypothetical protein L6164_027174 [Bauhinia variegata]|uniref:Uncharacterized protein n=1 Tax=Bauhinia variegata TaxID=167791 RepID=A0ACB9LS64_BAUVA|nr:hypothetical protein L6164_027174 [Bauhinia variegata]